MDSDRHPPAARPDRTPHPRAASPAGPSRRGVLGAACGGLALAALAPALAGCALWSGGPSVQIDRVALTAEPAVNNDSPVAVDLVILYDTALLPQVGTLPARDWFARREQFMRDFPLDLQVVSWEIVPGQSLPAQPVGRRGNARAGFIFADYFAPGDHRLRLAEQSAIRIRLLAAGFTIDTE